MKTAVSTIVVWMMAWLAPAPVLAWDCPQQADVDGDGKTDALEQSFRQVVVRSGGEKLVVPLAGPAVVRACLGDLDGDRKAEVVVGVVRATGKDPAYRQRLFVFSRGSGPGLQAKFLGTEGAGALVRFGLSDLDGDGRMEVLARERTPQGATTRVYRWEGYGLLEDKKLGPKAPPVPAAVLAAPVFRNPPAIEPVLGPASTDFERTPGRIQPVRLRANLAPAVNRHKYRRLPRAARRHLARHGFVVVRPAESPPEFHSLYIENQYEGLPSFVTADAALHLTHLLFDHALQEIEEKALAPALKNWLDRLRRQGALLQASIPARLSGALDGVLLKLDVAAVLLGDDPAGIAPARRERVMTEVGCIERARSGACRLCADYGDFKVRGHYSTRESLKRYFRAFLFLSSVSFTDPAGIDLMVALIGATGGEQLLSWMDAFGTTLVGPAANTSALDLLRRAAGRTGGSSSWKSLLAGVGKGEDQGAVFCRTRPDAPEECRLTVLARRWTADNDVLTATVDVTQRPFPDPLDLLAVLGSARARELLAPQMKSWAGLAPALDEATRRYREGLESENQPLGGRWLHALRWLLLSYPKGYASFQQSTAWQSRVLVAAAASWAELRRDTILYVQPPIVWAEGGDEESIPPARAGFVEPVPELYAELAAMLGAFREALGSFAGPGLRRSGAYFRKSGPSEILASGEELLRFLEEMAKKELSGNGLTRDEHERLSGIGSWFEHILAGRGRLRLEPVPVVADVYYFGDPETRAKKPLLVATGPVDVIVAAVPLGKRVILARGAILSFWHWVGGGPVSDEQWRAMLEENRAPPQPDWARPAATMKARRLRKRD